MKVFALGGYGRVGIRAVEMLAQSDLVIEIAVAGRNLERAERAASGIGAKATAVRADGEDTDELAALVAGSDIVVNAATDATVLPAIRAAIATGTHYCDVNAMIEPALELTAEARAADITAIVASGIGPCLTNLMGVHMARRLDEVKQLQRGMADLIDFQSTNELTPHRWLEDPNDRLAVLHEFRPFITDMLQTMRGNGARTALDHRDGRWVEVDPIRSGVDVPHDGGTVLSYPYVTCDSFFGGLPTDLAEEPPMEMWFTALPPHLHALLRNQALRVLDDDTDPDAAVTTFFDLVESDPENWLRVPESYTPGPKMWVRAVGLEDGRAARCTCWTTATVWGFGGWLLTSTALAVAAEKILREEVRERGVSTAEKAFEPESFFEHSAALLPGFPPDERLVNESFEWLA